jgi:hypothetical protein
VQVALLPVLVKMLLLAVPLLLHPRQRPLPAKHPMLHPVPPKLLADPQLLKPQMLHAVLRRLPLMPHKPLLKPEMLLLALPVPPSNKLINLLF